MGGRITLTAAAVALLAGVAGYSAPAASATAGPIEGRANAHGVWIHYRVTGRGAPVVLVHGLYSSARDDWDRTGITNGLARTNEVVTLDLAGHGESDHPTTAGAYGAALVGDVLAVMDALRLPRARIVGYSEGGFIALALMASQAERVQSAVLAGSGWLRPGTTLPEAWDREPGRTAGATPPAAARAMGQLALSEAALKSIRAPVYVIVGDRDPVNAAFVAPLRAARSDWPVDVVSGARHLDELTNPGVVRAIVEWVGAR